MVLTTFYKLIGKYILSLDKSFFDDVKIMYNYRYQVREDGVKPPKTYPKETETLILKKLISIAEKRLNQLNGENSND